MKTDVSDYPSLQEIILTPDDQLNTSHRFVFKGHYVSFLSHWMSYFSQQQFHIVQNERLRESPEAELQKIETFLGLKHDLTIEKVSFNISKPFIEHNIQCTQLYDLD